MKGIPFALLAFVAVFGLVVGIIGTLVATDYAKCSSTEVALKLKNVQIENQYLKDKIFNLERSHAAISVGLSEGAS